MLLWTNYSGNYAGILDAYLHLQLLWPLQPFSSVSFGINRNPSVETGSFPGPGLDRNEHVTAIVVRQDVCHLPPVAMLAFMGISSARTTT